MSREELRGRAGGADEKVFAYLVGALQEEGLIAPDRDKVRLTSHEVRLSAEQQRTVEQVEHDYLVSAAAPPSPEEALARAGLKGGEEHELFQVLVEGRRLVRVKESLFFHATALDAIQEKLIVLLGERKDIGPGDIKDLLGISRKYAIPLLEYFDGRRVTARVGERRVLARGLGAR
jgi:selenocysteine-specific elongation factor